MKPDEAYRPSALPDRIILTWAGGPTTTQAVTWRTSTDVKQGVAILGYVADVIMATDEELGSLRLGLGFLERFMTDVKKDTRPLLATLADLSAVKGVPQVATRITERQSGEPPVLAAKDAELIGNSLQEAVMGALDPYNEHASAIDIDEGTPTALKQSAAGLANAIKGLPPTLAKPMQMPLKFFVIAADDLTSL